MDVARPAVLTGHEDALADFRNRRLTVSIGDAEVQSIGWTTGGEWLVVGKTALRSPLVEAQGAVEVSRSEVEYIDAAIHTVVSMLTVSRGKRVSASAINPTIGFLGERTELAPFVGLQTDLPAVRTTLSVDDPFDLTPELASALADRPDGLALLAEALSDTSALGRYTQLLRLLELAFGRGIGKFNGELQRFLRGGATRHWFTAQEIQHWVDSRPRVMHADRGPIWYQRDVALTVERLREAAVDVLFNKRNWNAPDDERRPLRVPRRGSADQAAGFFFTSGLALKVNARVFDPFGSFPMFLKGGAEAAVPFGLWAVPNGDRVSLFLRGEGAEQQAHAMVSTVEAVNPEPASLVEGAVVMVYDDHDDSVRDPSSG
jgi:hypothetical protein